MADIHTWEGEVKLHAGDGVSIDDRGLMWLLDDITPDADWSQWDDDTPVSIGRWRITVERLEEGQA